jgi:hypothetical protein
MKTKDMMTLCLLIESALVLAGLLLKLDVWFGIVCYWSVLTLKNLTDFMDGRKGRNGG